MPIGHTVHNTLAIMGTPSSTELLFLHPFPKVCNIKRQYFKICIKDGFFGITEQELNREI